MKLTKKGWNKTTTDVCVCKQHLFSLLECNFVSYVANVVIVNFIILFYLNVLNILI